MTPPGGEHRCAKRHHSQTRGAGEGVKGRSRLAGARSAALEALIPPPQHHGAAVRPSISGELRGKPSRRVRFFVGMPGASRLFGGRPRAGS
jgi:hypothetical protein